MASRQLMAKPASQLCPLQIILLLNDAVTDSEVARDCGISRTKLSKAKYGAYKFTAKERARVLKYFNLPGTFDFDFLIDKEIVWHVLSRHLATVI